MRIGVVVGLVVALLGGSSCNLDPTANGFAFTILNDTDTAVTVRSCANHRCSKAYWRSKPILPHRTEPANTAAQGFDEWYQFIATDTNAVIGCITVNFRGKEKNVVIRMSSATACA